MSLFQARTLIAVLVLCSLLYLPLILDYSLMPRFTALAAVLSALSIVRFFSGEKSSMRLSFPVFIYGVFALFCCISVLWSLNKAEAITSAARVVLGFAAFVVSGMLIRQKENLFRDSIFNASATICLVLLFVAFWQFKQIDNFNKDLIYAVSGLQSHKNLFSSFLFLLLAFLTIQAVATIGRQRVVSISLAIPVLLLIVFLRTKAVWMGMASVVVTLAACMVFWKKKKDPGVAPLTITLIITVLAATFWLLLYPVLVREGLAYVDASGIGNPLADKERLQLWANSLELYEKHRLAGVGAGNWQIHFPDISLKGIWRAEDLNYTFQRPHNDFLWILSETGIAGLILYLLYTAGILSAGFVRAGSLIGRERTRLLICIAFACGFLLVSCFDFPRERTEHVIWFNILLAVIYYDHQEPAPGGRKFTAGRPLLIFSFVLFAFITFVGFLRMKGEFFTRRLYAGRALAAHAPVIESARAAQSFVYDLDPTSVPLKWYSGNAHAELNDTIAARLDFEEALAKNPFNRNVLNDLASAYVLQGRNEEAKKLYMESARISPRFDEAKLNLVAVLINEKKFWEANKWLQSLYHDSERRTRYQTIVDLNLEEKGPG